MKSALKGKTGIKVLTALAVVLILCIAVCAVFFVNSGQRLSEAEIAALRQEYPICGNESLFRGSIRTPSLEEVKEQVDTFIYGVVEGEMSTYSRSASAGSAELDAKRNENGIKDSFEFYEYTLSVIEDTEGIYKAGDKITIASSTEFMELNPTLSAGMEVVVPAIGDEEHPGRNHYGVFGMYYVTKDKYALSAFEESKMTEKPMSGIKVAKLLDELKR